MHAGHEPLEHYEQLFCVRGSEPDVLSLLAVLEQAQVPAELNMAYGLASSDRGWNQFLVTTSGIATFVELHRRGDDWEGSRIRGTLQEQILEAAAGLADSSPTTLTERLLATNFIVSTTSQREVGPSAAAQAIRRHCVQNFAAMVRINGVIQGSD